MKRIIYIVFAAFVLALVPAEQACVQWILECPYCEGLACVMDADDNWHYIDKTGKVVE